jgi:hypothetical protein
VTSLDQLCRIAELEFADIVVGTQALEPKRRLFIRDGSFVDVWVSSKLPGRFGFHWERRRLDGTFFRYDNFPDPAWRAVETFPHHFHDGSLDRVVASLFPSGIEEGFRAFMTFLAGRLSQGTTPAKEQ